MNVTTVGIDLAKSVFQLHVVDEDGEVVFRKKLRRSGVLDFLRDLPPCLIGLEACATAHFWAREIGALERKPARFVTVAMANKTARIAWAVLARGETYRAPMTA